MIYSGSMIDDLAWQVEAGADEVIGEVAGLIHWKAAPPKQATAPVAPAPRPQKIKGLTLYQQDTGAVPTPPAEKPASFTPHKVSATTLAELQAELASYEGCELKQTAMNLVFSDGNPAARIMVIGDAPAEEEDRQGRPFAGDAGKLLDKMLAAIDLDRTSVYLTNLVFWRPPGNRTPTDTEIAACLPFTAQHIALIKPDALLLLGATVTKSLLRSREAFPKLRGRWTQYTPLLGQDGAEPIRCLPVYHPTYLLRQPSAKRQTWAELLRFREEVNNLIPLKSKE